MSSLQAWNPVWQQLSALLVVVVVMAVMAVVAVGVVAVVMVVHIQWSALGVGQSPGH